VNLAIRLYADVWADSLPVLPDPNPYPNGVGAYYKQLVKGYVGLSGPASPNEKPEFVDGHAGFTRIYWDGVAGSEPRNYEPPAGYEYNWDGE